MTKLRLMTVALSATLAVALIGCGGGGDKKGGGGKGGDSGAKGGAPLTPEVKMAATDFAKEFLANEKAAAAKYKDKVIELEGEVESANQGISKGAFVLKGVKDEKKAVAIPVNIMCFVPASKHDEVGWLGQGQKVKVVGKFADVLILPRLMECEYTELGKAPMPKLAAAELAKEFAKDKGAANKKYENKEVIVEGKVAYLAKGDFSHVKLAGDGAVIVSCTVDPAVLKQYQKGDDAIFGGVITFFDGKEVSVSSAFPLKKK